MNRSNSTTGGVVDSSDPHTIFLRTNWFKTYWVKEKKMKSEETISNTPSARPETLGSRIRQLMKKWGYNQTTLAAKTGIERSELNRTINDKRHPQPNELAELAQALNTTIDQLLDGLELPPILKKTRDEFQELMRRAFDAEADRVRSHEERKTLENEFANERQRWQQERADLTATNARLTAEYARSMAQVRQQAATRENDLLAEVQTTKDELGNMKIMAEKHRSVALTLQTQLEESQRTLSQERTQKVATSALVGFAGFLLGGALGGGDGGEDDN